MKIKIIPILKYLIYFLGIIAISLFIVKNILIQNDLFFDLKTGENILEYGIDFQDHFCFIPNLRYLYHHFLYDIILFFLYQKFGFSMIKYFFLFFIALLGFSIFNINKKNSKMILWSFLISFITLYYLSPFLQTRVQTITFLLLFLEVYFWEKLYQDGKKRNALIIILLAIIILNLHMPIWIMTIILALPFLIETILSIIIKKENITKPQNSCIIFVTFIILVLSGLISPFKLYPYTFFINVWKTNQYNIISEMQRPNILQYRFQLLLFISIFILNILKILKIKIHNYFLIIGLFILGLIAHRHMAYITLFLPTIFSKSIDYNYIKKKIHSINKIIKTKYITIPSLSIILIIIISKTIIYGSDFIKKDINSEIPIYYPVNVVEYIKNNIDYHQNTPIYNKLNLGSYLAFNNIPIFIDSRMEVYIKEFNGHRDIITDYLDASNQKKYQKIFDKYQFEYAISYLKDDIYNILINDDNFTLIYKDNLFALFKNNAIVIHK